jgi:hypothetical protein
MAYDDLIIGSGLSALGAALALFRKKRRVLCIAGDPHGKISAYPGMNVPCEHEGPGGLGNFWHGVIPLAHSKLFNDLETITAELFSYFYPDFPSDRLGNDALFVPYRPIRPFSHLARLSKASTQLEIWETPALSLRRSSTGVVCGTTQGVVEADRAWIACGALGTPRLLERSQLVEPKDRSVSDHLIGYAGLVATDNVPWIVRTPARVAGGLIFDCDYDAQREVMYMPRPAHFDFAGLDAGIAKRAVFGLPTSRIVAGLAGRLSPGLVAEALYNKLGLFPKAKKYSVNYIMEAPALYRFSAASNLTRPSPSMIAQLVNKAVKRVPFEGLQPTQRPDLFIPGIHLHNSLSAEEREEFGGQNVISVIDASILQSIGPEHHSFRMLAQAYKRVSAES